jgi:serine/tyrosine/threonine adenylyltransferase
MRAMHTTPPCPAIPWDNSYARTLSDCGAFVQPASAPAPELVFWNADLARTLGPAWQADGDADRTRWAQWLSGNTAMPGSAPFAQVYAGHQFGHFSPQLGDGRALLLGEVITPKGERVDVALKGSGRTPFSRNGDGQATLSAMLREVLMGEALHALGIPTSRVLAVCTTGRTVLRQNGPEPGAVLTRIAASHLRVGTLQFFAARGDTERLQRVLDHAIARHDAHLLGIPDRNSAWLTAVIQRQVQLVAQWMHVGFIHGVMNTDNTFLSGETLDFGPCAFMDAHNPGTVFSAIDTQGRYAYANQPGILQWNLTRLAEAVLPLLAADENTAVDLANAALAGFKPHYEAAWAALGLQKLGLLAQSSAAKSEAYSEDDVALLKGWMELLAAAQADHTQAWRALGNAAAALAEGRAQAHQAPPHLLRHFAGHAPALHSWWHSWCARSSGLDHRAQSAAMQRINPLYTARNHKVEEALQGATTGQWQTFEALLQVLQKPFEEQANSSVFAEPADATWTAHHQTFCGT